MKFIDVLFPPTGESLLVRKMSLAEIQNLIQMKRTADGYAFSPYADERVQALIHEAKFQRNKKAFTLLNALLKRGLETAGLKADIIIPIPLSLHRLRERGYNQVQEILNSAHEPTLIPVVAGALARARDTQPQTELLRTERLSNLDGAFKVVRPGEVKGKRVLLVDDVMTTGATLRAARSALMEASPASVTCIALAH